MAKKWYDCAIPIWTDPSTNPLTAGYYEEELTVIDAGWPTRVAMDHRGIKHVFTEVSAEEIALFLDRVLASKYVLSVKITDSPRKH